MNIKKIIAVTIAAMTLCTVSTLLVVSTPTDTDATDAETTVFSDVGRDDWFFDDVRYVVQKGIMNGTGGNLFSPYEKTTRAMIVTALWRLEGSPSENYSGFDDVTRGDYFCDAVAWAAVNHIVSGYSESEFAPNDNATREQLAAVIYRYAAFKKYDMSESADLDIYSDKSMISDYAADAVAVKNNPGILGMTLTAYFDDEVLKLQRVENGTAVENVLELTPSKTLENGVKFLWDGVDLNDGDIRDGEILAMYFKVSDAAAEGKYPITLKCFEDDVVDRNLTSISPQIKSGYISVVND